MIGQLTAQPVSQEPASLMQILAIQRIAPGSDERHEARTQKSEAFFGVRADDANQPATKPFFDRTRPANSGDGRAKGAPSERMRGKFAHARIVTPNDGVG